MIDKNELITILKSAESKHKNDDRKILQYRNEIIFGNEMGIVLSNIDENKYDVFLHAKIDNTVISQILYEEFDNIEDATNYYKEYEEYIINNNLREILNKINDLNTNWVLNWVFKWVLNWVFKWVLQKYLKMIKCSKVEELSNGELCLLLFLLTFYLNIIRIEVNLVQILWTD